MLKDRRLLDASRGTVRDLYLIFIGICIIIIIIVFRWLPGKVAIIECIVSYLTDSNPSEG